MINLDPSSYSREEAIMFIAERHPISKDYFNYWWKQIGKYNFLLDKLKNRFNITKEEILSAIELMKLYE